MIAWTSDVVASVLGARVRGNWSCSSVSTDTRTLEPGALFVALPGERFDGHTFLEVARNAGAVAAVVIRGTTPVRGLVLVEVDDPLLAYGRLARHRRRLVRGPVVAITGTNGKTSTKEMVLALMRTRWKTHGTRLNNNNRVGVPLTILEAPPDCDAFVVEAGANERGEIALLRDIIEPTVGVVTNVAAGHLAGFTSLRGVLEEKTSLLVGSPTAVVGESPPELSARARELCPRVLVAGFSEEADVRPEQWELDDAGCGTFTFEGQTMTLGVPGTHQIANAMVALATGRVLDLPKGHGAALTNVTVPKGRCEVLQSNSFTILNDTYNANPASLRAVLELAQRLRANRRLVVVVGSMLELGERSAELHAEAASAVLALTPDVIGALGEFVPHFENASDRRPASFVSASSVEELGRALRGHLEGGELVVLKASRGVGLDRIIPFLTQS